jgi:hypothetical protein
MVMMPSLRRFIRKAFRIFLYCAGGLVAAILVMNLVENWRGRRAWAEWRVRHEVAGVAYDWAKIVPACPSDVEDFGKARIVELAVHADQPILKGLKYQSDPLRDPGWRAGKFERLDAWEKAFGTTNLEEFLKKWEGPLGEFTEACRLPDGQLRQDYPPPGHEPADGFVLAFRQFARIYRIRALERLRVGRAQEALEDVRTILRLSAHIQKEPGFMTFLMEAAVLPQAFQPIWEGLVSHRWNAAQLSVLQGEISKVDLVGFMKRNLDSERVWQVLSMGKILDERPLYPGWLLIPKGWVRQNMVRVDRFFLDEWMPILDPVNHRVDLEAYRALIRKAGTHRASTPYTWLWQMDVTALVEQTKRMAYSQSALDQAAVACALERYRMANRTYPEKLEDLVPRYLEMPPKDLLTGRCLSYRLSGNGTFDLHGFGWDGQDHGGMVVLSEEGRPGMEGSDWVWPRVGLKGQIR